VKIGKSAIEPVIATLVGHKDAKVRRVAADVLGEMKAHTAEVVPALVRATKDPDQFVRQSAARGLGKFPKTKEVLSALEGLQTDSSPSVRYVAAFVLVKFDPKSKAAVPGLCAALTSDNFYARGEATQALERIGPGAVEAVPALVAIVKKPTDGIRTAAALALARIKPDEKAGVPALINALAWRYDPKGWLEVYNALKGMASSIVTELTAGLAHKDCAVREALVGILSVAGPEAVPALVRALRDDFNSVRCQAAKALGALGPKAKKAVPALIEAAEGNYFRSAHLRMDFKLMEERKKEDQKFEGMALEALKEIDPEAAQKVRTRGR
jgi:HEAT repeat protein